MHLARQTPGTAPHCASGQGTGTSRRAFRWVGLLALLLLVHLPGTSAGQELVTTNPRKIEAAFLRNFARYVTWPTSAFSDDHAPWCIGVLGGDPFGEVLEKTVAGRTEQGRGFRLFRADALSELPLCQIVVIEYDDAALRRAALARLRLQPVLTVGEAPEFLAEGGIVRFDVDGRVEISVNLDQARSVSLTIQTKMLEVSREVLVNGAVRRRR